MLHIEFMKFCQNHWSLMHIFAGKVFLEVSPVAWINISIVQGVHLCSLFHSISFTFVFRVNTSGRKVARLLHCPSPETVERLCCKRTIQCLASSKILTPTPLTARRVCTPRLWCGGRPHSLGGKGGGGSIFWETPALYLYIRTLYLRN